MATPVTEPARLAWPLALAGTAGAAAAALHLRDPHVAGAWGFCPVLELTGLYCPGCGGLRAVHDLTHLDVAGAASSHLLLVAALPVVAAYWMLWVRAAATGHPAPRVRLGTPVVVALAAAVVLFSLLRNTPYGAWLAP